MFVFDYDETEGEESESSQLRHGQSVDFASNPIPSNVDILCLVYTVGKEVEEGAPKTIGLSHVEATRSPTEGASCEFMTCTPRR